MRNSSKVTTLESKFPLLSIENNCILSKEADITICFKVGLPEIFTVSSTEYEAIHSAWFKAVKTLPDYCIVHKQDWFIKEDYHPDLSKEDQSFLSKSFERHFNERPFLNHYCYLFITKTSKERMRMQSNFSSLCKGQLIPKELRGKETVTRFKESVDQFERILNDSGYIQLERILEDELTGTQNESGLLEQYLTLSRALNPSLQDLHLGAEEMRIGNNRITMHTLAHQAILEPTKFDRVIVEPKFSLSSTEGVNELINFWTKVINDQGYGIDHEGKQITPEEAFDMASSDVAKLNLSMDKIDGKKVYFRSLAVLSGKEAVGETNFLKIQILRKHYERYGGGLLPRLLKHSKREISFYHTDPETGIDVKVRPDALQFEENIGCNAIISIKSSACEDLRAFMANSAKLHYDLSEGMYQEVCSEVTGRDFNCTITIFLQTVAPFAIAVLVWEPEDIDLFGYVEDVFTPDINPTFKGKVSGVGSLANGVQKVLVSNMDFDLKEKKPNGDTKYWIAGTPPKISVTKGDLAGYDFEVLDYIHSTKTFKLKQFADDKGQKFPDNTTVFKFAAGDEFTLIDIMMPDQYITNAEQKLYDETVKEYQKVSQNNVKYTLNVDPLFLQDKGEIGIGDLLPIKDADFGIDKASRIISLKKDLLTDSYTSFDVADSYEISLVKEIVNNIKDLQKEIASQKVINRQSYLDGYRRVEDRFSMYFDADGKMDGSHIKADTIDVGMLSSGSKSRWFQLEEVVFTTNLGSDQNSFRITAGRLVHFGIKTSTGLERVWNLASLSLSNLLNQGYYVYAKCDINGDYGTFVVTPDRIIFDSQPNYYHFLIGNLYSPSNGFRIFDTNYGVSQVNGRQITAGEIASVNRRLIIDLDKGEIIGKVTFTNDSPALNQVQEKIDAV